MRKPRHLSPTSFALWEEDKEKFYTQYLSDKRFPKDEQTLPMAIGSAFDYLIKKHLTSVLPRTKLLGGEGVLKMQVEEHVLKDATIHGNNVFKHYCDSGVLAAITSEIIKDARFEFGVTGCFIDGKLAMSAPEINRETATEAFGRLPLILNGRPDAYYKTRAKFDSPLVDVIHDWKVNGWLSATKSPDPGYICCHSNNGIVSPPHKDAFISFYEGIKLNRAVTVNRGWLKQLAIYGWVLGVEVGTPFIGSIDQVIGPENKARVARHRFLIPSEFQKELYGDLLQCWEIINSDWIFREMTQEDSVARCQALETQEDWMGDFENNDRR